MEGRRRHRRRLLRLRVSVRGGLLRLRRLRARRVEGGLKPRDLTLFRNEQPRCSADASLQSRDLLRGGGGGSLLRRRRDWPLVRGRRALIS